MPLVKDGDSVALAQCMIRTRGRETVRVTKVTGHATDADVAQGRVRLVDQLGNAEADTAADLDRRHQSELIMDARRSLLKVRTLWYPVIQQLHRFMITVSRIAVNRGGKGGSARDPLVWDHGERRKVRRTESRVNVDIASLPGPRGFLTGPWMQVHEGCITGADVAAWRKMLASYAGLLLFMVPCIGRWIWWIWVILGFPIWRFFSFSSNGLDTGCLAKRLLGLMSGLTVPFLFPLCLCQRELKSDMGVSSFVAWFGHCPNSVVGWVGSCHVVLALTCPGYIIWGGINVITVSLQGHWNLVTMNALVR